MSESKNTSAPLHQLLLRVARVVDEVLQGVSMTESLAQVPQSLRPATQALSFIVMRNLARAQALRRLLVKRAPAHPHVDALLVSSLALLSVDESERRHSAFTLVNQAVEAVTKLPRQAVYKGLLNACLRRFLREQDELLAQVNSSLSAQWNYPAWWISRVKKDYPAVWQAILQAGNQHAPMTLRVNVREISGHNLLDIFTQNGIAATLVGSATIVLHTPRAVQHIPGFTEGWWSVQDAGAQRAAPLLAPEAGDRVLDACAAPGGKTAHLLELFDIDLLAVDVDSERLLKVQDNLRRLKLSANLKVADISQLDSWWDGRPFDAILADVPCTASGIVRRHPDIRWLRRESDISQTVRLQAKILDSLWQTLASNGKFLYVTCSLFPAEGEEQIQQFLSSHKDALRLPAPGQLLPSTVDRPLAEQHDGFFYALLKKQ